MLGMALLAFITIGNMAHTYAEYKSGYETLLKTYKVRPEWKSRIDAAAARLYQNKHRYKAIEDAIGVPWAFVAVIHSLESGGNFSTHLHNGDPLTARTRRIPRGYPKTGKPPFTWEESAIDALKLKSFHLETDWSDAKVCYNLEKYNGFGYRQFRVNSPYLWSGTTVYSVGKYVSDGKWSASAVSQQVGAMPLYKKLQELDAKEKKKEAKEQVAVLKETSQGFWITRTARDFFRWLGIGGATGATVLDWNAINNFLFSWKGALLVGGLLGITWLIFEYLDYRKRKDFQEGRHTPSKMRKKKNAPIAAE